MPKPVCVKCQRFYRPKRNAIRVVEGMPTTFGAKPGADDPQSWQPYKIWAADLWHCEGCGHELIYGFGHHPISEHYIPGF